MEQHTPSSYGVKTQLSLASLMFFAPFIKHFLNEEEWFELKDEEKSFIKGYMVLGTINLGLAVICITLGLLSSFFAFVWLDVLFLVFSSTLLLSLVGGSIGIFANIPLGKQKNITLTESIAKDLEVNQNSLRDYIPFVNLYLWYHLHDFEGKHPIIKESLLMWTLFGLICLTWNIWFISIFLMIIIVRIVTLMVIGDLLPQHWHQGIDLLFHKNIEEIWWWCTGCLIRSVGNLFGRKSVLVDKRSEQQLAYSYLYDLKKYGTIQWQYVLLIAISGYLLSTVWSSVEFGFVLLGSVILLWRYIMMAIVWWHLPPLPIINDIFRGVRALLPHKKPIANK